MAKGDEDFSLSRHEAVKLKNLKLHPKGGLFGDHLLVSKAAAAKAAANHPIPIELSESERMIVDSLE